MLPIESRCCGRGQCGLGKADHTQSQKCQWWVVLVLVVGGGGGGDCAVYQDVRVLVCSVVRVSSNTSLCLLAPSTHHHQTPHPSALGCCALFCSCRSLPCVSRIFALEASRVVSLFWNSRGDRGHCVVLAQGLVWTSLSPPTPRSIIHPPLCYVLIRRCYDRPWPIARPTCQSINRVKAAPTCRRRLCWRSVWVNKPGRVGVLCYFVLFNACVT